MNQPRPLAFLPSILLLLCFSCARQPEPIPAELFERMAANVDQPYRYSFRHEARWLMNMGADEEPAVIDLEVTGRRVMQAAGEYCSMESELLSFDLEPDHQLIWAGNGVEHYVHQEPFAANGSWTCSLYGVSEGRRHPFRLIPNGGWTLAGQALALLQQLDTSECVIDDGECQFLWTNLSPDSKQEILGGSGLRWEQESLSTVRLHVNLDSGLPTLFAVDFGDAGYLDISIQDHEFLDGDYQSRVEDMVASFEVGEFYHCECGDIPGNPPLPSAQR